MVNKSADHTNDVMLAQFIFSFSWSILLYIDHRNEAKNVQNFAVKAPASGSWLHLRFEHFDVFSIVDSNIIVYLLINANNLINKNV